MFLSKFLASISSNWMAVPSRNKFNFSKETLNLFLEGTAIQFDEIEAKNLLKNKTVNIYVNLGLGDEEAVAWGCDLTNEYVNINASYRT